MPALWCKLRKQSSRVELPVMWPPQPLVPQAGQDALPDAPWWSVRSDWDHCSVFTNDQQGFGILGTSALFMRDLTTGLSQPLRYTPPGCDVSPKCPLGGGGILNVWDVLMWNISVTPSVFFSGPGHPNTTDKRVLSSVNTQIMIDGWQVNAHIDR